MLKDEAKGRAVTRVGFALRWPEFKPGLASHCDGPSSSPGWLRSAMARVQDRVGFVLRWPEFKPGLASYCDGPSSSPGWLTNCDGPSSSPDWLRTTMSRIQAQVILCRICGGHFGTEVGFLPALRFRIQSFHL
jgi:hypothetical protein